MKKIIAVLFSCFLCAQGAFAASAPSIFSNSLIWLGTPNPLPPSEPIGVWTSPVLRNMPPIFNGVFGWFGAEFETREACVLGLSGMTLGPFGTVISGNPTPCGGSVQTGPYTGTQPAPETNTSTGGNTSTPDTGVAGSGNAVVEATGSLSGTIPLATAVVVGTVISLVNDSDSGNSSPTSTATATSTSTSTSTSTATAQ